jgi:hypothetical protein
MGARDDNDAGGIQHAHDGLGPVGGHALQHHPAHLQTAHPIT